MAQGHKCPLIVVACPLKDAPTARCPLTQRRSHDTVMTFAGDADPMPQLITRQSDTAAQYLQGKTSACYQVFRFS